MDILKKLIAEQTPLVLWGMGLDYQKYGMIVKKELNVKAVCDRNNKSSYIDAEGISHILPEELETYASYVIIMLSNKVYVNEIVSYLKEKAIEYLLLSDILSELKERAENNERLNWTKNSYFIDQDPAVDQVMMKYIALHIPVDACNLSCPYCYVSQRTDHISTIYPIPHSAKYLRNKLRHEKIGGGALIGLCGAGETMLLKELNEICLELLKEGHYMHIVTNGLITDAIKNLLQMAGDYCSHIIFKLSFHYSELKEKNLLDKFVDNVKLIENSPASYTLELMPNDDSEKYIEEIKIFSLENFGAYPQLTIGRDDRKRQEILTRHTLDEFEEIWGQFNSSLFKFKLDYYRDHYKKEIKNCCAGDYSFYVNLKDGEISRCLDWKTIDNIFYTDKKKLDFGKVCNDCKLSYCYNCHAFVAMGVFPDAEAPTYLELRDRIKPDGTHWVKEPMRKFLNQKIYINHLKKD